MRNFLITAEKQFRLARKVILNNLELMKFVAALVGGYVALAQANQALLAYKSDLQWRLISHSLDILKLVKEKPGMYDYFYRNKDLNARSSPEESAEVETVGLMYLDLFEHICLQSNGLSPETGDSWKAWAKDILDTSPITRRRLELKRHWYSDCVDKMLIKH